MKLSIIGFGGILVDGAEQQLANRLVAEAFEKGANDFDVSPTYGDAELKLGPVLEQLDEIFPGPGGEALQAYVR